MGRECRHDGRELLSSSESGKGVGLGVLLIDDSHRAYASDARDGASPDSSGGRLVHRGKAGLRTQLSLQGALLRWRRLR